MKKENPFRGPKSYEDGDSFFGRDAEIKDIYNLVKNQTLTLLFARSGTGKSSLIKAGLIPYLREENEYLPVYIHLNDFIVSQSGLNDLCKYVIKRCEEEISKHLSSLENVKTGIPKLLIGNSLFEFLNTVQLFKTDDKSPIKLIIIFDQFEEIFTHPFNELSLKFLIAEIRCLIESQLPEYMIKEFDTDAEDVINKLDVLQHNLLNKQKNYRIIFSFREEYLPQFESLKEEIPYIRFTNSRYRLEAFNVETATDVIQKTDSEISGAIAKLISSNLSINILTNFEKIIVEPFLLSLVCQKIYYDITDGKNKLDTNTVEIIKELVDTAIERYIDDIYNKINDATREFIELKLITSDHKRTPFNYNDAIKNPEYKDIDRLIDDPEFRLLNKEQFLDSSHIEILHDRLLPPLAQRRSQRLKNYEDKALLAKQLELEQESKRAQAALEAEQERALVKLESEKEKIELTRKTEALRHERERIELEQKAAALQYEREKEKIELERTEEKRKTEALEAEKLILIKKKKQQKINFALVLLAAAILGILCVSYYSQSKQLAAKTEILTAQSKQLAAKKDSLTGLDATNKKLINRLNIKGDSLAEQKGISEKNAENLSVSNKQKNIFLKFFKSQSDSLISGLAKPNPLAALALAETNYEQIKHIENMDQKLVKNFSDKVIEIYNKWPLFTTQPFNISGSIWYSDAHYLISSSSNSSQITLYTYAVGDSMTRLDSLRIIRGKTVQNPVTKRFYLGADVRITKDYIYSRTLVNKEYVINIWKIADGKFAKTPVKFNLNTNKGIGEPTLNSTNIVFNYSDTNKVFNKILLNLNTAEKTVTTVKFGGNKERIWKINSTGTAIITADTIAPIPDVDDIENLSKYYKFRIYDGVETTLLNTAEANKNLTDIYFYKNRIIATYKTINNTIVESLNYKGVVIETMTFSEDALVISQSSTNTPIIVFDKRLTIQYNIGDIWYRADSEYPAWLEPSEYINYSFSKDNNLFAYVFDHKTIVILDLQRHKLLDAVTLPEGIKGNPIFADDGQLKVFGVNNLYTVYYRKNGRKANSPAEVNHQLRMFLGDEIKKFNKEKLNYRFK